MMDRKNIKLPAEDYKRHNKRRKELGLTWLEYVNGQAPEYPTTEIDEERLADVLADRLPERLARELEARLQ